MVGESPSLTANRLGAHFAGQEHEVLEDALAEEGESLATVNKTYLVACPVVGTMKHTVAKTKTVNERRIAKGKDPLLTPIECCAPRLREELKDQKAVLGLGNHTMKTLAGNFKMGDLRGSNLKINLGTKEAPRHVDAIFTANCDTFSRKPHWAEHGHIHIARAVRMAQGRLKWKEPPFEVIDGESQLLPHLQLRAALSRAYEGARICQDSSKRVMVFDWETGIGDPWDVPEYCVGLGNQSYVAVVPFHSKETQARWWNDELDQLLRDEIVFWFRRDDIIWVGQNSDYFDRQCNMTHLGAHPRHHADTIMIHRTGNCEDKHSLAHISAQYIDVPAWKAHHLAITAETDETLHWYCAMDIGVTDQIYEHVLREAVRVEQYHLYATPDRFLQELAYNMKMIGFRIDHGRRLAHMRREKLAEQEALEDLLKLRPMLNPNSTQQMRAIFYGEWGYDPVDLLPADNIRPFMKHLYTESELPSTSDFMCRLMLMSRRVQQRPDHIKFIKAYRKYKHHNKRLSFLNKWGEFGARVHAGYSAHGTVARFSSKGPNFQQIPWDLRDVFVADPGHVFIYLDQSALEMRSVADLANLEQYRMAFDGRLPIEPHAVTALSMFGEQYWLMKGHKGDKMKKPEEMSPADNARQLAKTRCYLGLYGGSSNIAFVAMTKATDDVTGELRFPHLTPALVKGLDRQWKKSVPELELWWDQVWRDYLKNGYVEEPFWGRRRRCLIVDEGSRRNAVINFGPQAAGFGIVTQGMMNFCKVIPQNVQARTGIINNTHDSVIAQVPEEMADEAAQVMEDSMAIRFGRMDYFGKAKVVGHMI